MRRVRTRVLQCESAATIRPRKMAFLTELFIFLRDRRKAWLRPVVVLALIVAGLIALSNGVFDVFLPSAAEDHLAPLERGHYRQDRAFFNRYSAIKRWPLRLG